MYCFPEGAVVFHRTLNDSYTNGGPEHIPKPNLTRGANTNMPGRPKLRALDAHIQRNGGDELVFNKVMDGETMEEIASSFRGLLKDSPEFPSRPAMYGWIRMDDERHRQFKALREFMADENYAKIHDLLFPEDEDDLPKSPVEASVLKQRVGHLERRAANIDPKNYGEQTQKHEVNISLGDLHLDALRSKGAMPTRDEKEEIEEADYELLEEEDADRQALPADS